MEVKNYTIISLIFLSGCQSINNHVQCEKYMNEQLPAVNQQKYTGTETKCSTKVDISILPEQGNKVTTCKTESVYETVAVNEQQRRAIYEKCMSYRERYKDILNKWKYDIKLINMN